MDRILPAEPSIEPADLSSKLGIPVGEAMVILSELRISAGELEQEISQPTKVKRYGKVCLGGTFSVVHHGHLSLLWTAFSVGEKVVIGLTSDNLVQKIGKSYEVPPYEVRLENLRKALAEHGWLDTAEIMKIDDPYGPSVTDQTIDAIVVSPSTAGRAAEINDIRMDKMLTQLEVVVCPMVLAQDGKPINSSRICRGEISPEGEVLSRIAEDRPGPASVDRSSTDLVSTHPAGRSLVRREDHAGKKHQRQQNDGHRCYGELEQSDYACTDGAIGRHANAIGPVHCY